MQPTFSALCSSRRLLVELVPTRRAGHRTVIDAVASERGIGALNAAFNLLEAELHDSGAQPWNLAENPGALAGDIAGDPGSQTLSCDRRT